MSRPVLRLAQAPTLAYPSCSDNGEREQRYQVDDDAADVVRVARRSLRYHDRRRENDEREQRHEYTDEVLHLSILARTCSRRLPDTFAVRRRPKKGVCFSAAADTWPERGARVRADIGAMVNRTMFASDVR